ADLFDELTRSSSPLDIELPEPPSTPATVGEPSAPTPSARREPRATGEVTDAQASSPVADQSSRANVSAASPAEAPIEAPQIPHRRAADAKIDSAMAARATEVLLRPPDAQTAPPDEAMAAAPLREAAVPPAVQPRDYNVLVIDDDTASCDLIAQTL